MPSHSLTAIVPVKDSVESERRMGHSFRFWTMYAANIARWPQFWSWAHRIPEKKKKKKPKKPDDATRPRAHTNQHKCSVTETTRDGAVVAALVCADCADSAVTVLGRCWDCAVTVLRLFS